jgi:hypothetical protein
VDYCYPSLVLVPDWTEALLADLARFHPIKYFFMFSPNVHNRHPIGSLELPARHILANIRATVSMACGPSLASMIDANRRNKISSKASSYNTTGSRKSISRPFASVGSVSERAYF